MVGILVQVAISWALLWFIERKHLTALGIVPTRDRLLDFLLFFTVTGTICAGGFWLKYLIADKGWILNPDFTSRMLAEGAWWNMKSVLFEELIFRGALFYILIQRFGARPAIWVSAVAFGVYHWFSHGTFGNPQAMFWDFTITGAMGLVLAYGFVKTGAIYVPVAIHFGWNLVQQTIFSSGPIGKQLLIEDPAHPQVGVSMAAYLFMTFAPLVAVLGVNAWVIAKKAHAP